MELMLDLPDTLSDIVQYIDRPILLVDANSTAIVSINQAGLNFFKLQPDLSGLSWPGILSLAHVPDSVDMTPYWLIKQDSPVQAENQRVEKLSYIDQEDSTERSLEFQIIKPRGDSSVWAIIIVDKTDVESSMRSRSDFATMASHELRTPLTGIKWNVGLFLKRYKAQLSQAQLHILENTVRSINRMHELILALLQLSRIETGSLRLKPKLVEVHKLLQEIVEAQIPQAKQRNVQLITSFHQNLPQVFLDGTLIGYVFENLIANAIKYSRENSDVTIFLSRLQDTLLLQVTDSGIGIPRDHQRLIFEKFYRDPNAMQHAPDGTGLGLHLCRIIAHRSGGEIWFESKEGKGTTFWFTIPIKGATVATNGSETAVPSPSS
ncbi:MAG TPA: HAMP domain-containing sensor histidine kinase [Candidatus Saccharimonadales bacterium]|nr:HAMP domain-containing sensor histidine kinase [Candidatus Saccharimonadales bacterium]